MILTENLELITCYLSIWSKNGLKKWILSRVRLISVKLTHLIIQMTSHFWILLQPNKFFENDFLSYQLSIGSRTRSKFQFWAKLCFFQHGAFFVYFQMTLQFWIFEKNSEIFWGDSLSPKLLTAPKTRSKSQFWAELDWFPWRSPQLHFSDFLCKLATIDVLIVLPAAQIPWRTSYDLEQWQWANSCWLMPSGPPNCSRSVYQSLSVASWVTWSRHCSVQK